jgi:uncharacterized membrane protein YeaQ/YmgE (transglycosylase-associated protein family)
MSVLTYIVILLASGLLVGALARLALPRPEPMTLPETILLGLAGNTVAGILIWLFWNHDAPAILIAFAISTAILYLIRRSRGGGLTDPGRT